MHALAQAMRGDGLHLRARFGGEEQVKKRSNLRLVGSATEGVECLFANARGFTRSKGSEYQGGSRLRATCLIERHGSEETQLVVRGEDKLDQFGGGFGSLMEAQIQRGVAAPAKRTRIVRGTCDESEEPLLFLRPLVRMPRKCTDGRGYGL